ITLVGNTLENAHDELKLISSNGGGLGLGLVTTNSASSALFLASHSASAVSILQQRRQPGLLDGVGEAD
ncbi:hypothetical protein FRC07_012319, partial [Ceratobasidium sp. 392]